MHSCVEDSVEAQKYNLTSKIRLKNKTNSMMEDNLENLTIKKYNNPVKLNLFFIN